MTLLKTDFENIKRQLELNPEEIEEIKDMLILDK
jgi:hypothetical protein